MKASSPRDKWPKGGVGFFAYVVDHRLFGFDEPVDWHAARIVDDTGLGSDAYIASLGPDGGGKTDSRGWGGRREPIEANRGNGGAVGGPHRPSFALSDARRVALVWLAVFLGVCTAAHLAYDSCRRAYDNVRNQAISYAHLIAAHDQFDFSLSDVLLRSSLEQLTWHDFNDDLSPDRKQHVVEILTRHRAWLPGVASFSVIGADGIRRAGIAGKDNTNLSDRGYFMALRDGQEFFISNVEDGRASGKAGIHVARRFNGRHGEFGGVLELNLAARDVFFPFYKSLKLDSAFQASLRDQHRLLIRFPVDPEPVQQDIFDDAVGRAIAQGDDSGVVVAQDGFKRVPALTAYERLGRSQIYATVSVPIGFIFYNAGLSVILAVTTIGALIFSGGATATAIRRSRGLELARADAERAVKRKRKILNRVNAILEEERKNVSAEIHDELNANLIGVKLDSQRILVLAERIQPEEVSKDISERARSIIDFTAKIYAAGRAIARRLRPEMIDVLGLEGAVEDMVKNIDTVHPSCTFMFESSGERDGLSDAMAIAIYRVIQEALSNIVKHACATKASVRISSGEENVVRIEIEDNGKGFDQHRGLEGVGIAGMHERIHALHGTFSIASSSNGTRLDISLPLSVSTLDMDETAEVGD